jgi:hypothetical protein
MKSFFVALTALASLAVAVPSSGSGSGYCLCDADAEKLVSRYAAVIAEQDSDLGDPVTTAKAIIARNYAEQSDSANQQIGIPVSYN